MKKLVSVFAALVVCISAGVVEEPAAVSPLEIVADDAAKPFYFGLGAGVREIRDFDNFFGSFIAGYMFSEYFGFEGRYNVGNNYNTIGGYLKAQYPTGMFTPYVLAGYAYSDYDYGNEYTYNYSGFSWGGGTEIETPYENLKAYSDVVTYEGADDTHDTDHVLSVGVKYFF